jgi:hypothetical protein
MSNESTPTVATMGIDIGKNSFHVVGLDQRGAIVLRQKWSRGQVEARLNAAERKNFLCWDSINCQARKHPESMSCVRGTGSR